MGHDHRAPLKATRRDPVQDEYDDQGAQSTVSEREELHHATPSFPSRRDIHARSARRSSARLSANRAVSGAADRSAQPRGTRRRGADIAKTVLVTALFATTVVLPTTGFVGPQLSITMPAKTLAMTTSEQSWAGSHELDVRHADDLAAVPAAASRARARTPLQMPSCVAKNGSGVSASGRAVEQLATVVWPLKNGTFTYVSPFGVRFHPIFGRMITHEGIDLAGSIGTPIYAAADGEVVDSRPEVGVGYWLRIKHTKPDGEIYYTAYAHMYASDVLVSVGDVVKAGDQVASIGNTGNSTGPHLHFEVHDASDTPIDPWQWLQDVDAKDPGSSACD